MQEFVMMVWKHQPLSANTHKFENWNKDVFANDLSHTIKIWWKFHFTVIQFPDIRLQQIVAHATT